MNATTVSNNALRGVSGEFLFNNFRKCQNKIDAKAVELSIILAKLNKVLEEKKPSDLLYLRFVQVISKAVSCMQA